MQKNINGRNGPKSEGVENLFTPVARCVIYRIVRVPWVTRRHESSLSMVVVWCIYFDTQRCDMLADRTGAAAMKKEMQ